MTAHKTSAGVQEMACGALRNIACNNDNMVDISATGGIEALATSMKTHQARARLQENACAALYSLAKNVITDFLTPLWGHLKRRLPRQVPLSWAYASREDVMSWGQLVPVLTENL
jgi:hypothetical protein